jgi:polysaccharide pyruvyl transferase WcaK-like protein
MAYKIEKQLGLSSVPVDYKIWEYEPDIESCVYLLRKAKLAISMRFHGCIFSLVNHVPTVGIDYSVHGSGKVYELFQDLNLVQQIIGINEITSDILIERIRKYAA